MTPEATALELWREWFEEHGDPTCVDPMVMAYCFFCRRDNPIFSGHEDSCIYIRAKTLVQGPQFEGLKIEIEGDKWPAK